MAIIILLFLLLFLVVSLTAISYSFQSIKYTPPEEIPVDERCSRTFIRDSWIFGTGVSDGCPPLENDYYVEGNRLYIRDIVSGRNCCSFSQTATLVRQPSVLVGNETIISDRELNTKPYLVNYERRNYNPVCYPCGQGSVLLTRIDDEIYRVQNDGYLFTRVDDNLRVTSVINTSGDRDVIEASLVDGELRLNFDPSIVSPTTIRIVEISNRPDVQFQPLPLPS